MTTTPTTPVIPLPPVFTESSVITGRSGRQGVKSEVMRLVCHSSHYLAGFIANIVVGLVSFPIFTRVFSIAEYGTIDLAQRVLLIVTIASKAGFQNGALRFYDADRFQYDAKANRTYYSTMFFGMLLTSTLVISIFVGILRYFPQLLASTAAPALLYLVCGVALLRAMGSILWAFLRIEERTRLFNFTSVAVKAGTVAVICFLLMYAARSAQTYFSAMAAVEAVLVVALTVGLLSRGLLSTRDFNGDFFRKSLVFGMPLILYEFAFAVLGSADRFMVRYYLGADALGFYSVAHGLARNVNELLVAPLGLAILPIYMRLWNSDGPQKTADFLNVALECFVIAAAGVLAIVTACAQPLVTVLASTKYAGADRIVPLLLAGLLIYASHVFVAAGLLIRKKTLHMAGVLVFAAVFNIGANAVLLPRIGLVGGAISTLLSCTVCILALGYASRSILRLHVRPRTLITSGLAAAAAWAFSSAFTASTSALTLLGRFFIASLVYFVVLYFGDHRVRTGVRSITRRPYEEAVSL